MKKILLILALLPLCLSATDFNLKDLWSKAEEKNNSLKQIQIQKSSVESQMKIKESAFYPKLTGKGSFSYISEVPEINIGLFSKDIGSNNKYDFALSLQQPVFTGFRLTNDKKSTVVDQTMINLQEKQIKQSLYLQIAVQYYKYCSLSLQKDILFQSEKRLCLQRDKLINLLNNKQITPFDTLEISNRLIELRNSQNEIETQANISLLQIKKLTGLENKPVIRIEKPSLVSDLNTDNLYLLAEKNKTDFQMLDSENNKLGINKKIAESLYYPQVFAQTEIHYANPGVGMESAWQDYFTAGIGFSINVWDWNETKEKNRQVTQQLKINQIKKEDLRLSLKADLEALVETYQAAGLQISLSEKIIEQERYRLSLNTKRYENSQASMSDVLDNECKLTEASLKCEIYKINQMLNLLNIQYICGIIGE